MACGGALGDTGFAVDALFGVNEEHRFAFFETFDGANNNTIGVFAVEAGFRHNVSHKIPLQLSGKSQFIPRREWLPAQ